MIFFRISLFCNLLFTFHYGPIQISSWTSLFIFSILFTFHYGPIQIWWRKKLHLTCVLIYIPLWSYSNGINKKLDDELNLFTFHYGPIQIEYPALIRKTHTHLHSTMVLFKFGSINLFSIISYIYIPLWSYSNCSCREFQRQCKSIYIPLWSYSNRHTFATSYLMQGFTFHYGPIQMSQKWVLKTIKNYLHSTMVLFKFYDNEISYHLRLFTFHYGPIQMT